MRRSAVALAVLLLGGCGQGTSTSNAAVSPTPSPPALVSPAPVACRMPVNLRVDQGGNREVLGYLALPSGATTDDPNDSIVKVADVPVGGGATVPVWGTVTPPQLFGDALGTYSPIANRWLPAPPELVSPDGRHYTYLHADGSLGLAAADGSDVPIANPNNLTPLAYTSAGVVLVENGPAASGLWLLDPTTESITPLVPPTATDDWREVSSLAPVATSSGGTFAYGLDSPGVLGAPPPTTVLVAELPGGVLKTKTVFTAGAGDTIALIAADRQAGLLVVVTGATPSLVYLDPNAPARTIPAPAGVVLATIGPRHHADAHGIWFIGSTGVFLFNSTSGLQKIAPGVTTDIAPGGDCT
jgi:hypothetical protein